jgi:hypothetical protein
MQMLLQIGHRTIAPNNLPSRIHDDDPSDKLSAVGHLNLAVATVVILIDQDAPDASLHLATEFAGVFLAFGAVGGLIQGGDDLRVHQGVGRELLVRMMFLTVNEYESHLALELFRQRFHRTKLARTGRSGETADLDDDRPFRRLLGEMKRLSFQVA